MKALTPNETMKPRGVKFPSALWQRVCEESERRGIPKTELIRQAVQNELSRMEKAA